MKMKSNNMFREQVNSVTSWFSTWSTCEQTVALYSLLKQIPPLHCRFLVQMLQQRVSDNKEVQLQEQEANDPAYISNLSKQPEEAIQELLNHLPLLHSGNTKAKCEYLNIIPQILSHSIEHGVFIEESRQLLSYSLIHPAITSDERSKFNMWLGHLDERFSNYHSPVPGQPDDSQGQCQNVVTTGTTTFSHVSDNVTPAPTHAPTHAALSKQSSVGCVQHVNGWSGNLCHSVDTLNSNGLEGRSGSQGNLYSNAGGQVHARQQLQGQAQRGHMPLQATLSAPANFNPIVSANSNAPVSQHQAPPPPVSHHAPLRRMKSMAPPNTLPITSTSVSDWLKSNDAHLVQGPGRPGSELSDHAPLSPQSSTASSGSGSDTHVDHDGPQPLRNTFMEEGSGMRDVPLWLKSLRLHKYAYLFQQMTYDHMLNLTEDYLDQQNVTKGARNKIVICIKKLQERQEVLQNLERDISEGGPLKSCISEMKAMLNSPLKAFIRIEPDAQESPTSPGAGGDADNSILEGDIPGQFTRLMRKVFSQLMLTRPCDDEGLNMYLQLIDKCINHEAFSQKQKKLLDSFRQQARKIWQPAPVKYGYDKKARPNWGNTFPMGTSYNGRPIQRTGLRPPAKPIQAGSGGAQWSFGAKRSVVGGTMSMGHLPLHKNNSHNMAMFSQQAGRIEAPMKTPVARTQSAPLRSQGQPFSNVPTTEPAATDTEINARLDSLCLSVTGTVLSEA